jgi:(p)ppGpp synthase/HD superfamily hydrolase
MHSVDNNLVLEAMAFACEKHRTQRRKYTGNPYSDHLAEVAGIVSIVLSSSTIRESEYHPNEILAIAWLHDCMEDQAVTIEELYTRFGRLVADGVHWLSELEPISVGNRAVRKAITRTRLAKAPAVIQTIKVADLISNTSSIVSHDPRFAVVYLEERRLLLDVLAQAHPQLIEISRKQI